MSHGKTGAAYIALDFHLQGQIGSSHVNLVFLGSIAFIEFYARHRDGLVKGHDEFNFRAFRHHHVATVFFQGILEAGVFRVVIGEINLFNLGQVEQANTVLRGILFATLVEGYIIGRVFLQGSNVVTIGGTVTAAAISRHGQVTPVHVIGLGAQLD